MLSSSPLAACCATSCNACQFCMSFSCTAADCSLTQAMGHDVTLQAYKLVTKQDVTGLDGLYEVHPALATPPHFSSEALRSWWYPNSSEPIPVSRLGEQFEHPSSTRAISRFAKKVCMCFPVLHFSCALCCLKTSRGKNFNVRASACKLSVPIFPRHLTSQNRSITP